jgi:hypothetical protein
VASVCRSECHMFDRMVYTHLQHKKTMKRSCRCTTDLGTVDMVQHGTTITFEIPLLQLPLLTFRDKRLGFKNSKNNDRDANPD